MLISKNYVGIEMKVKIIEQYKVLEFIKNF